MGGHGPQPAGAGPDAPAVRGGSESREASRSLSRQLTLSPQDWESRPAKAELCSQIIENDKFIRLVQELQRATHASDDKSARHRAPSRARPPNYPICGQALSTATTC